MNTIRRPAPLWHFTILAPSSNVTTELLHYDMCFHSGHVAQSSTTRDTSRDHSAYLLHSVVESFPVGVAEEPRCGRLDIVHDLIDRHQCKTHAVHQLTGKLLSIDAIKGNPPDSRLHTRAPTFTQC